MVQSAKLPETATQKLRKSLINSSNLYALGRIRNTVITSGNSELGNFGASGGGIQAGAGNYLKTQGDTMVGPIAFYPRLTTLSNNQFSVAQGSDNFSSRVIISPQSGSTDDLITITGAAHAGQLLFLQGVVTDTITIKDSTSSGTAWVTSTAYALDDIVANNGVLFSCKSAHTSSATDEPGVGVNTDTFWFEANIETLDGADFSLEDDDIIILMFDTTDNKWQQITLGKQSVAAAAAAGTGGVKYKVGSFVKSTGGAPDDQSITGVGFEPKAIVFFTVDSGTQDSAVSHMVGNIGFTDGDTDKALLAAGEDFLANPDTFSRATSDRCIAIIDPTTKVVASEAILKTMDSDGFTLTWNPNNAGVPVIKYVAIGGAAITTEVGVFQEPSGTGTQNVATGLDSANFVMLMGTGSGTEDANTDDASLSLGMASGSLNQGVTVITDEDAPASGNANANRYQRTDNIYAVIDPNAETVTAEADFTGFTSSGFNLNWTGTPSTSREIYYLTVKGGQWEVGNGTFPTSVTNKTFTTTFKPIGLFHFGFGRAASTSVEVDASFSLGANDNTTEAGVSVNSEDANASSNVARIISATKSLLTLSFVPATLDEAELLSFNDTDFKMDFTKNDSTAKEFLWFVVGDVAVPTGVSFPIRYPVDRQGDKTGTVTHDLSLTTAHKIEFTATGDCDITISNIPTSADDACDFYIEVTQDNTGNHAITFNDSEWDPEPAFGTAADTVSLISVHADGDGKLRPVLLLNATITTAGATVALDNLVSPILNTFINFDSNAPTNFPGFTNAVGQALVVDGAGVTWDMPTGDTYKHRVNGVNIAEITNVGLAMAGTISMGENFMTFADIAAPANPGVGERRQFVDTATGEMSVRTSGGTTISLEAGAVTTFDDNVFTIQDEVDNTKTITFNASLLSASGTVLMSYAAGASRTYTFPATTGTVPLLGLAQTWGATQTFQAILPDGDGTRDFGSTIAHWDDVFTENLTLRGSGDAIVSTRPMVTADGSNVIFHAPSGDDFIWQTAGATTKMQFNTTGGSDDIRIRAGASRVLGFITDSSATTLGTSGTMKMPVDTGSVGNAAAADTDFGDDVGCFGIYLNTIGSGNPTFCIKIDDGTGTDNRWLALTYDRTNGAFSGGVLT